MTAVVVTPTSAPHAVTSLTAGGTSALKVPDAGSPLRQDRLQLRAASAQQTDTSASPWDAALRVPGPEMTSDLYTILRELESLRPDSPRIGRALRLAHDIVRLGQEPSLAFPAGAVASVQSQGPGTPWYVQVHSFGVLGPNGPMPLHFTEYVWQRLKHHADRTLVSFLNLFHHRMLSFFYRAWVDANPAVSADRPALDRFRNYVAALLGVGTPALQQRDAFGDSARRYYAGQFVDPVGNPEGLKALIEDHFGVPCAIEEFMGEWVDIPESCLWKIPDPLLGPAATAGRLGLSTNLGSRVWLSQGKFRVVLGPLTRHQFNKVSPGGEALPALSALVRGYVGDSLRWDLRLRLRPEAVPTLELGTSILGQTSWLWSTGAVPQDDLVFEPRAEPSASPNKVAGARAH